MFHRLIAWIKESALGRQESQAHAKCPVCGADLDQPGARRVHEKVLAEFAARPARTVPPCEGGRTL